MSWRRCIWVASRLRKGELQYSNIEWTMDVAMVEAVLESSMGRMRRRSRMCMKQERERLEMWLEKERRGSKVTPRWRTGALEVKVVEDELSERCIEGSGIFLIWADRPIRMNSVLEGLRRKRLDYIH